MDEINDIYRALLQLKTEIDSLLSTMEGHAGPPSVAVQQRVSSLISEFSKSLNALKEMTTKLEVKSRMVWDTRVSRFSEDFKVIKVSCDRRLGLLFKSQKEKEDRDFLFGSSASVGLTDAQGQLLTESRSLHSSHNMMDAITDQSRAVLDRLVGQNSTLKNARGKMYDLINSAGIGQSLAGSIHSRERADAIILYGCMGFTILIFFLLWWFVR